MYHTIEGKECFWKCRFGLLDYLMGTKQFRQKSDGEVYPYWMPMQYTIKKTNPYIGFRAINGRRVQEAVFVIPTFDVLLTKKSINISAGFHIRPTALVDPIMRRRDFVKIYVVFKRESILFYDGVNVSVSDFLIVKPDLLFKQIEAMAGYLNEHKPELMFITMDEVLEKWKEEYRKFYQKLENWYKERRKK